MNTNFSSMAEKSSSLAYQSMVIRYWLEHHPVDGAAWRCLLVNPQTGKQLGFKSFTELSHFLTTMFDGEV